MAHDQRNAWRTAFTERRHSRSPAAAACERITFPRLALALANDYQSVYCISIRDSSYVEYGASGGQKKLCVLSGGDDFFADIIQICRQRVDPEDQHTFLAAFRRDELFREMAQNGSFTLDYRRIIDGSPCYYSLCAMMENGSRANRCIIIGVRNVDEQVRRAKAAAKERRIYSRIAQALASRYEAIYYINVETNEYVEYSASADYTQVESAAHGTDFFRDAYQSMLSVIFPEDLPMLTRFHATSINLPNELVVNIDQLNVLPVNAFGFVYLNSVYKRV